MFTKNNDWFRPAPLRRAFFALLALAFFDSTFSLRAAQSSPGNSVVQQVKTVFVIGMENHNFTQPSSLTSPQQIFGNPAAPYLNSLLTPGNSNAAQVSFATKYYSCGVGVHPSEPNYVWAEAGSDFAVHTDNDPATNNTFTVPHLTGQLNAAGISWKNYQEDVEYTISPTISVIGASTIATNAYNHTAQYFYAAKHNPMGFFTDTQYQNYFPLTNLFADLTNNSVGRYNWITPDMYNDQHSSLNNGFVYHGMPFTGDQAGVAQGDNFLATIIRIIMASPAYQNNGVIIIRWDETEGGDDTNFTIPEIIISPLAKGNAYASSVSMNHSSDLKTMDEIFGLNLLSNPIPSYETAVTGSGYNDVATVSDLSDLFQTVSYIQPVSVGTNSAPTAVTNFSG